MIVLRIQLCGPQVPLYNYTSANIPVTSSTEELTLAPAIPMPRHRKPAQILVINIHRSSNTLVRKMLAPPLKINTRPSTASVNSQIHNARIPVGTKASPLHEVVIPGLPSVMGLLAQRKSVLDEDAVLGAVVARFLSHIGSATKSVLEEEAKDILGLRPRTK